MLCVAKVQKFAVHVILNHELLICSLETRAQKVTVSIELAIIYQTLDKYICDYYYCCFRVSNSVNYYVARTEN